MESAARLVQLAAFDNPREGSFIPMVLGILGAAKNAGWSAEAVFLAPAGDPHSWVAQFEAAGIPLRFAPRGSRRAIGRWLVDVLAESEAPTMVHTHFTTFDLPAVLAARRRPRTKVVWHEHTVLNPNPVIAFRNAIKFAVVSRMTSRILCPSQNLVVSVERLGAPKGKVMFVPNAIDLERFPLITAGERASARQELGLPDGATVLLHFGWAWEVKGGDIFLRVVRALRESASDVIGLSITTDPAAQRLRDELGLGEGVRIVPLQPDVRALYAAADIFVTASRGEGAPFAVIEALASGLPVVATDLPGHRYVSDAIPGCTISGSDPAQLAEAIRATLQRGAPFGKREAERVRERIAERFELRRWSERVLDLFDQLLADA